jgi:hypothetical protein
MHAVRTTCNRWQKDDDAPPVRVQVTTFDDGRAFADVWIDLWDRSIRYDLLSMSPTATYGSEHEHNRVWLSMVENACAIGLRVAYTPNLSREPKDMPVSLDWEWRDTQSGGNK